MAAASLFAPWSLALPPAGGVLIRAVLAGLLCLLVVLLGGRWCIACLGRRFREPAGEFRGVLRAFAAAKVNTPTAAGLPLAMAVSAASCLFLPRVDPLALALLLLVAGLTGVGLVDDWRKLRTGRRGLSAAAKLAGQLAVIVPVAWFVYRQQAVAPALVIAGWEPIAIGGAAFVGWATLVMLAAANAVNLTDGLDGLAAGCAVPVLLLITGWLVAGDPSAAAAGLAIPAAAAAGALVGFLRFNRAPAQVFLGDCGALPLGGLLGFLALASGKEWLLPVCGGVFVVETASVIVQVLGLRVWGRRALRCAPLHHHFQLAGVAEATIVNRFWLASSTCCLVALAILKLGLDPPRIISQSPQRECSAPPGSPSVCAQFEAGWPSVSVSFAASRARGPRTAAGWLPACLGVRFGAACQKHPPKPSTCQDSPLPVEQHGGASRREPARPRAARYH